MNIEIHEITNEYKKNVPSKNDVEEQRFQKANSHVEMDDVKHLKQRLLEILETESGTPSTGSRQNIRFPNANPTILRPPGTAKKEQHHSYNKPDNSYDQHQ